MPTKATVQSRIAGLAGDNTQVISGVAVGAGDITRGLSGDQKVWQAAELREAAASLEGTPVNPLHSEQTVGEVVRAGYEPGTGVIYEAELSDESLAEQAASGGLEVSIEARHADGGTVETDRGEAMAATNIRFTGLSLVQRGAAPSASAEPGEAAALSPAAIHEALETAALAEVNGETVDLSPPEAVVNAAEAALNAKEEYDTLSDCGTGVGETRAEQIASGDLSPEDFTSGGQAETAIPDYLNSHSDDVNGIDDPPTQWSEETWTDGCGPVQYALWGGTATGTGLEWAQSTADAVEAAMENADMGYNTDETANMAEVPDEYVFSNPGEAVSKAQDMGLEGASDEIIHTHGEGDDTEFMPAPSHDDLMEMLREMDELAASAAFSAGDLVRWSTSASPGTGRVAEVVTEPGETVSANGADVTRAATEDEAAYKLDDYVGPEAGYDEGVVVKSASEMLGEWDDAPEEAQMAAATDDPETGEVAGGESESRTDDQTAELNTHMSDTEQELRARLSEKDDELATLQNEVEQLKDEREDVARAYAEALAAGDTILSEDELVDKFEVAELRAKVENTESATLADTEPSVQSGGGESNETGETATLSDDGRERIREINAKLSSVGSALPDGRVTDLREEAADLAGTDSYDEALEEL